MRKALSMMELDPQVGLEPLEIDPQARPEVLTPEQFLALYRCYTIC